MSFRLFPVLWIAGSVFALELSSVGAGENARPEPAIALPPFLVEARGKGPPWRCARSPEFEILSRCPDATTQEIAQNFHRLHRLLNVVLPERFQVKFDVPKTLILYDQELLPLTAQAVLAEVQPPNPGEAPVSRRPGVLRNPRFSDLDAMTVFASVPASAFYPEVASHAPFDAERMAHPDYRPGWTSLTPSYVEDLIGRRTPALPGWFASGFTSLYRKMHFAEDTVELGAATWLSETATRGPRKNGEVPLLLPMTELFHGPGGGAQKIDLWFAQSELFVRWGLDDPKGLRRESFWKFLDRAAAEPASEALFKECFGLDYDQATAELTLYLRSAVFRSATWRAAGSAEMPALEFHDATGTEIARIKGDWERLAAGYVRNNSPTFEAPYLEQARRTLHRAYDKGDRDPRLAAVLGLCECDAGNGSGAREYLEKAVRGGVIRPRACLELARLRLADVRAGLESADVKLGATQTADVLTPLLVARRQAPALREIYELIAEVWANSAVAPQRSDFDVLDEGVSFFPGNAELIHRVATLYAAQGFSANALTLADSGLHLDLSEAMRERFTKLRAAVSTER